MASIHKRAGSDYWYASFRAHGKQYYRSTGYLHTPNDHRLIPVNKSKALAKAKQMERKARATKHNAPVEFKDYAYAFVDNWANHPDAKRRARNVVTLLCAILGDNENDPPMVVTREHILRFKELRLRMIDGATFNSELSCLHNLFDQMLSEGLVAANPVDFDQDMVLASSFVRTLTIPEVTSLLEESKVLDWRTAIYCGFYTGCQLIEIAYRLWTDLQRDGRGRWILRFPPNGRNFEKLFLVHPALVEHFKSVPRISEFICPTLASMKRWTVDARFAEIVAAAGLEEVTFRCLRHTFAAQLGVTIKRLSSASPRAIRQLPDIRVPPLPCQKSKRR